ncbi:protein RRP5 homolog [Saccoglossus kowalevskii]|uniref:Protein RRP5 homolog n=1 Tax=Saccoglossus kowalevskii TaxID=10224 RepID=A0ABM0M5P5_SACKO|nr:PREDICTED: protein RRP5 homolog [Saccoglossus kowalevskii]
MEVTGTVIGYRDIKFNKFLPISHHNLKEFGLEISLKKSYLQENTGTESANQEFEYTKNFDSLLDRFKEGQSIYCYVEKYENKFLRVDITPRMRGVVYFLHLSKNCHDLYSPEKHFKPGQAHKALVMKIDKQHKKLDLSLDGTVSNDLKEGAVQNGWITHKYPTELGVQLAGGNHGNVFITDINDKYSDDPIKMFRINQFVRCCILDCKDEKHVTLSLRQSRINHNIVSVPDKEIRNLCDLSVGDIVKGYVKDYSEVGVFVSLSKELKGRIQLKNLSSYYVNKSAEAFYCGKLVTAKVLSIDVDNSKIELSIHPEHTGLPDQLEKRYRGSLKCVGDSERRKYVEQRKKQKRKRQDSEESDSGIDGVLKDADSDSEVEIITSKMSNTSKVARLELAGFSWDDKTFTANLTQSAKEMSGDSDSEDDDTNEEPLKKKTKKERQQEEKEEEKFLYRTELSLMDQDRAPENVDDFDRLVLSSPDSSMIWIRYMAFYLHTTDIDKARAVAERALKTISFREEQEKLNVWVAYLNLENLYGTNETLVKLFERALQMCDPLKVFRSMINIYTKTQKLEEAEQLYSTMVRRFNFHKDVWASYGMFLMKSGKLDAARKIMQRSFKSLDKSDHVEIIVKFAQFEFKFGEPERGRTMFENVLSNYPKRTDIWSIYIDMVIKQGHIDAIRQLFERVIHLNLSPKRMKFFFKRYLEFEKKYGEESTVENVKQKAMHYVESKVSISESS